MKQAVVLLPKSATVPVERRSRSVTSCLDFKLGKRMATSPNLQESSGTCPQFKITIDPDREYFVFTHVGIADARMAEAPKVI